MFTKRHLKRPTSCPVADLRVRLIGQMLTGSCRRQRQAEDEVPATDACNNPRQAFPANASYPQSDHSLISPGTNASSDIKAGTDAMKYHSSMGNRSPTVHPTATTKGEGTAPVQPTATMESFHDSQSDASRLGPTQANVNITPEIGNTRLSMGCIASSIKSIESKMEHQPGYASLPTPQIPANAMRVQQPSFGHGHPLQTPPAPRLHPHQPVQPLFSQMQLGQFSEPQVRAGSIDTPSSCTGSPEDPDDLPEGFGLDAEFSLDRTIAAEIEKIASCIAECQRTLQKTANMRYGLRAAVTNHLRGLQTVGHHVPSTALG
ncbi:hypothetical protein BZA05DRAFT_459304 [Tricharina praecox]|uniref:uncharacterized protein n=1 Tax=Tricharina praecox TaxID=43433 RepID=UPI0022205F2D|nr:uncharacterized protein BZA05DRAFT_459304 [Tricharina praecox]KAI5844819.1 hypothetical protein BZA05DRAFT_459304 [Tricharina praecox]